MIYRVTIADSGRQFEVSADESILDAALRHGIMLPYGCRNGACGSCAAVLQSGTVSYPGGEPEAQFEPQQALICQARAESDLTIAAREVKPGMDLSVKTYPCRAEHLERLSHDVMLIQLKLPQTERMQFLAGQYIEFILKDGRRRAFSLANSPHQDEFLELHIRHIPGGTFTGHVFDELRDRALMRIEGPFGGFYLREDGNRPILMVGGGTGFAPLKSMLEHLIHTGGQRSVHLFWGVRAQRDLYLDDLPREWQKTYPWFQYTPVLSEPDTDDDAACTSGLVTDAVTSLYPSLDAFDIYMSGPPAMVEAATTLFTDHGALRSRMYSDAFEFAADVTSKIAGNTPGS